MNGMIDNTQKPKTKMDGSTDDIKTKDGWIGGWLDRQTDLITS